jgi:uncharacterized protein
MVVEWNAAKAASNFAKHGVSFAEAETALMDERALAREDISSITEPRWVLVGMSERARLLTVVYALRPDDRIRLISARKATRKEELDYA